MIIILFFSLFFSIDPWASWDFLEPLRDIFSKVCMRENVQFVKVIVFVNFSHSIVTVFNLKCRSVSIHCCYHYNTNKSIKCSVIFPPRKTAWLFNCWHHHMIVLYHQFFGFDPHHPPENLVQKLTRTHLPSHCSVKPFIAKSPSDILETYSIRSENPVNFWIVIRLLFWTRHQIPENFS